MKCNDSNAHLLCDTKLGNISAHLPDFVPMSNMLRAQSAIFHFLVTFLFKFHFYFLFYICIFCICMLFYRRSEFTLIPLQVSVVHACSMQRRWPVSLQPPLHPQPVTNIPTKDSKLKVDFQVKGTMKVGRKKRGKENGKNESASAIHAYCHGHRTCRRACRAAAYAHRLFLALIYLPAKQPFVINLSRLTCIQFPCTHYSPWWLKTNRRSFSFSFFGGEVMRASLFCFRSSRRLFLVYLKIPHEDKRSER